MYSPYSTEDLRSGSLMGAFERSGVVFLLLSHISFSVTALLLSAGRAAATESDTVVLEMARMMRMMFSLR